MMVSGCSAFSKSGGLVIIDGTINSALYQMIMKEKSVHALKLKSSQLKQQDNDPKHTCRSISEWPNKTKRGFAVA